MLSFLTTLRAFKPGIIEDLRTNKIEIESVLGWIPNVKEDYKIHAEAALLVDFPNGKKAAIRLEEIRRLATTGPIPAGQEAAARRAQNIINAIEALKAWTPNVTSAILSLLTFSVRFK